MNRRNFMATAALASMAGNNLFASDNGRNTTSQQFYELRKYFLLPGESGKKLNSYFENALIPALNELGVQPVGVFKPQHGDDRLTKYLLIPHASPEAYFENNKRLYQNPKHLENGKNVLNATLDAPAYRHFHSSFLKAFTHIPQIEVPDIQEDYKNRIFELRIYQSQSYLAGQKKIEMFNEGGELEIFRKTGLTPVFFGEAIFGTHLPNLTYMLVFKSLAEREENWNTFRNHPEWKKLSGKDEYKKIVSNITSLILQPEKFSQV